MIVTLGAVALAASAGYSFSPFAGRSGIDQMMLEGAEERQAMCGQSDSCFLRARVEEQFGRP